MKKLITLLFGVCIAVTAACQVGDLNDIVRNNTLSPTRVANALDAGTAFTASGTDTYTAAVGLGVYSGSATYEEGNKFTIIFTNANTVTTPTININSEGAKTITDNKGDAVAAGDIEGVLTLMYDGTNFRVVGAAGGTGGGVGTVTSVGIALGTSGTDAGVSGSPVTTSGNITLNLPSSSASNRGLLTSADWSTFNGKSPSAGSGSLTTTGTLTSGSTGTGFTLSFTNSTLSGRIAEANIPAMYVEDQATTVTTGGTITLDCNSQKKRVHVGSATFATPKTIALSNTTNARQFFFLFQITNVAAVLTMPADFLLNDPNWDESANTWTPTDVGRYILAGYFDGTNWWVNISGAPYN